MSSAINSRSSSSASQIPQSMTKLDSTHANHNNDRPNAAHHNNSNSTNNKPPFNFDQQKWNNIPDCLVEFFNVVNQKVFEIENAHNSYKVKTDLAIRQQSIALGSCTKQIEDMSLKLSQSKQATATSIAELRTQQDGKFMQMRVKVEDNLEKFHLKIADNHKTTMTHIDQSQNEIDKIRSELEATKQLCDETMRLQEDQSVISDLLMKNTTISQIVQTQQRLEVETTQIPVKIAEAIQIAIRRENINEKVEKQMKEVKEIVSHAVTAATVKMPSLQLVESIQAKLDKDMKQVIAWVKSIQEIAEKKGVDQQSQADALKQQEQISEITNQVIGLKASIESELLKVREEVNVEVKSIVDAGYEKAMVEITRIAGQVEVQQEQQSYQQATMQAHRYAGITVNGSQQNSSRASADNSAGGGVVDEENTGNGVTGYLLVEKQLSELNMKVDVLSGQVVELESTTDVIQRQQRAVQLKQQLGTREEIRFAHVSKLNLNEVRGEDAESLSVRLLLKKSRQNAINHTTQPQRTRFGSVLVEPAKYYNQSQQSGGDLLSYNVLLNERGNTVGLDGGESNKQSSRRSSSGVQNSSRRHLQNSIDQLPQMMSSTMMVEQGMYDQQTVSARPSTSNPASARLSVYSIAQNVAKTSNPSERVQQSQQQQQYTIDSPDRTVKQQRGSKISPTKKQQIAESTLMRIHL